MCVPILPHICPHTTTTCVRKKQSPHPTTYMSSYNYYMRQKEKKSVHRILLNCVPIQVNICVPILLYLCPHTSTICTRTQKRAHTSHGRTGGGGGGGMYILYIEREVYIYIYILCVCVCVGVGVCVCVWVCVCVCRPVYSIYNIYIVYIIFITYM